MPLALRILAALPGALFCLIAIQWLLSPGEAAHGLDLPLLSGAARSTQIGDTGAFFLGIGTCFLLGAIRLERQWFQAAALLVGGAAFYRVVAWAFHGAPFTTDKIGVELFTLAIAAFAASRCRGGR
jgi:Domain of unknown function (DUF4345)